jgi:hypothetical protein
MTGTEIVIVLLALIVVLLFFCWRSLRSIGGEIGTLSDRVHGFIYDYEQLNNFDERKRLHKEGLVDKDFAEWQAKHSKDSR